MKSATLRQLRKHGSAWAALILLSTSLGVLPVSAAPGDVTRVSVSSSGEQADAITYSGVISANGRFVAFESEAGNLIAGDTNGLGDVFVRDRQLNLTTRVSVDASGGQASGGAPAISADGRFVAFESGASNLVGGDTNNFTDIFIKDMQTGAVARVSVDSSGAQSANDSSEPSISGDGRYVAFVSDASNLVADDTNGVADIFVHDNQTGTTVRVFANANAASFHPSISLDGRFVVFVSAANNLVANDTNGKTDVFVYAVQTGQVVVASVNSSGALANKGANEPSISGDGRYVTFSSYSENLLAQDTLGFEYVYVHDFVTGATDLASFQNGYPMYGHSNDSVISADGRYIAFSYDDRGDGLPTRWIYVHDRVESTTVMLVGGGSSDSGEGNPILPSISGNGSVIAFASGSSSLVAGDTNGVRDIFVKEFASPVNPAPTVVSVNHFCPQACGSAADQIIHFQVTFSEPVTGVDASDFALSISGGISGAAISGVSGAGSVYDVTVNTGSGDGTLRLDVVDDDSVKDGASKPLGGAGAGNGNFNSGEEYVVAKTAPAVVSILRLDANPNAQASVRFAVNFSMPVSGVDAGDFALASTGSLSGLSVAGVSGADASYTVTVNTGAGSGTLRLDLVDNHSILSAASVPLSGSFTAGEVYAIERNAPPTVKSITRLDANPSSAASVSYRVTFSEAVTGVDAGDFSLFASGLMGASLGAVGGSGDTYTVSIATGSGNGSLRLDLADNDSILNSASLPLGGAANGSFSGETYTIAKTSVTYSTVTFRSSGSNDGWVLESGENTSVGGSANATAPVLRLGDDRNNAQYRAILHFPTQSLPDNAVITQVILTIKKQSVTGINPFSTHQNIQIDLVKGNFGFDSYLGSYALQALDFQAPSTLDAVGFIQNNPVGDVYWALLNGDANRLINLQGITQLRLAFQLDDNNDFRDDYLNFFSGDADELLNRPHLRIEYYVP
ncbi:MAG: PD40 domain-containing protein [Anaerolineales bacterium]|nr:PD40 domain-containing protein [Anaerolineales bacterium]